MLDKLKEIQRLELQDGVYSVYDMDGKTTQEIFNQFFSKINSVIDATNASISLMDYLIDGGLKEETAKVFAQWIEDGTLKDILDNQVLDEINAKVNNAIKTVQEQKDKIEQIDFNLKDRFEFLKTATSNNIKFFGAVGDGITDDTEAFKKALFGSQYLETNTIFIPSGVYLLSESIELPMGCAITGEANTIIKLMKNNIQIILNSNTQIKNINFITDSNIKINNLIDDKLNNTNLSVLNCKFKNLSGVGSVINIEQSKNVTIKDCLFENMLSNIKCINMMSTYSNSRIINNTFISISESIVIDTENKIADVIISDNTFVDCTYRNIYINAQNINVLNNTFYKNMTSIPVFIEDTNNTKIKNNIYDVTNNSEYMNPVLIVENAKRLIVDSETVYIESTNTKTKNKELYILNNAKDTIFNNIVMSGKHYADVFANIKNSSVTFRNSSVETDLRGKIETMFAIENTILNLLNNNLSVRTDYLVKKDDDEVTSLLHINNNNVIADVIVRNIDEVVIENSKIADLILTNTKTLELKNNVINNLQIDSCEWDITSENNIFNSAGTVYALKVNSSNKCSLYSKNNYIKNAERLIWFTADENVLSANNIEVKTINDTLSDAVVAKNNVHIVKSDNITSDIYKKCYVDTKQHMPAITSCDDFFVKLLNVKRPAGSIISKPSGTYIVAINADGQHVEKKI